MNEGFPTRSLSGIYPMYEDVRKDIGEILDPSRLRTIEDELERIRNHAAHIERLEHDRNALVSHYSRIAADHLDELEPQERNRVYKMLGLTVLAHRDGSLEAKWALGADPCRDNELLPPGSYRTPGR